MRSKSMADMIPSPNSSWMSSFHVVPYTITSSGPASVSTPSSASSMCAVWTEADAEPTPSWRSAAGRSSSSKNTRDISSS